MQKTGWMASAKWDFFWIHSALWLPILYFILYTFTPYLSISLAVIYVMLWMTHRLGSIFVSFGLNEFRHLIKTHPFRFVFSQLFIFTLVFAFIFMPRSILPLSFMERLSLLFVTRFYTSRLHYSFQHFGVLNLYHMPNAESGKNPMRTLEKYFSVFVGLFLYTYTIIVALTHPSIMKNSLESIFLPYRWPIGVVFLVILLGMGGYLLKVELRKKIYFIPKSPTSLAF